MPLLLDHLNIKTCFFKLPTPRELEYLLISDRKVSNQSIAETMSGSVYAIDHYLSSIKNKLNEAWDIHSLRTRLRAFDENITQLQTKGPCYDSGEKALG